MASTSVGSRRPALGLLCAAQFMLTLDFAIVNVALPAVQRSLGFSATGLPWVVGAYALFFGGFLLIGGRFGDLFGRKRMFLAGLTLFTVASLIGGLATVPIVLIVARALQGLGAAAASPAILALIAAGYPQPAERAKAMWFFGATASAGFTGGVLAGGILTQYFGWRAVMFVNLPVGIVLIARAIGRLDADHQLARRSAVDVPGAVLVTAAMCAFSYALTASATNGWGSWQVESTLIGGAVLLVAFLIRQARVAAPLVPLGIFKNRNVAGGNLVAFLSGGVMSISTFFIAVYMQQGLHYSAVHAGLAFFPQAFIVILASPFVALNTGKIGAKPILVAGAVLLGAGSLVLTRVGTADHFWSQVLPGGLLLGVGVAIMMISTAFAATAGVAGPQMGLASGLYNSSRQLGVGLCLALATTAATSSGGAPTIHGYHTAFTISIVLSVLIAVASAVYLPKAQRSTAPQPAAQPATAAASA